VTTSPVVRRSSSIRSLLAVWNNRQDSTAWEVAVGTLGTEPTAEVRIGVAGWDYPDWRGRVYPTRAPGGFDRLAWIARYVEIVEVNATFYRPVPARRAAAWVTRVADRPRFRFTAKAHRSWTHEPGADLDRVVPETLEGLAPIRDAGRLEAVLVQFPQRFHAGPDAYGHLESLAVRTRDWPIVVEVRHRSWARPGAVDRVRALGFGWCVVDQPRVGGASDPVETLTSDVAYVRLHGRNADAWFRDDAGRDERYDYRYSHAELREIGGRVGRLATTAESVVVVQNNHFRGQAVANALQLRAMVEGRPPRAPTPLVSAFPDLAAVCRIEQDRLF
jgi:uncharacterized protein YecE (DUF72 family)